jgi:tetratricopeptide (TPR) repeat protein
MEREEIQKARFERVRSAYDARYYSLAILRARRYLARYSEDGYAWYLLGVSLGCLARYGEAEEAFATALRLCPDDRRGIPLSGLGHLEAQRGAYERAAGWFRQAIEAAPRDASGYIDLGGILAKLGQLREAEQVHRTATETCYEGDLDEVFLNLGFVLRAQERYDEAADCFREAIRINPGNRAARRALRDVERCVRMTRRPP